MRQKKKNQIEKETQVSKLIQDLEEWLLAKEKEQVNNEFSRKFSILIRK